MLRIPRRLGVLALSVALTCAAFASAEAGTIAAGTYELFDHGFGDLGSDYGLRVETGSSAPHHCPSRGPRC
jgi:hypothetical protein